MATEARGDDDLIIGAEALSREVFNNVLSPRQVYRLAETDRAFPIFKILGKLAGRRGPIRAELARREQSRRTSTSE